MNRVVVTKFSSQDRVDRTGDQDFRDMCHVSKYGQDRCLVTILGLYFCFATAKIIFVYKFSPSLLNGLNCEVRTRAKQSLLRRP